MVKYLGKRIFYIILTLFIVSTITFFLMKFMPGTPLTNQAKLTPGQIHQIYKQYGLDKPVWQQYLVYLAGVVHGNFGISFQFSNQAVSYLIGSRIGPSLIIGGQGMILGVLVGLVLGSLGAVKAILGLIPLQQLFQFCWYPFHHSCWRFCCNTISA